MAKRFNLGIDVDGVLANFTLGARDTMKQIFKGRPSDDLVQTTWAFSSLGISDDEEKEFWKAVDRTPNWWMYLKPMPNTLALPQIHNNHRCVFITNRKDGTGLPIEEQTQEWIYRWYGIRNPNVVISSKKGPTAIGLDLDYFIDDRIDNIEDVYKKNEKTNVFLQMMSYNLDYITDYRIMRVDNFDQFAAIVEKEAYGK